MQFVFLDTSGKTLFIRNDAISAQWTQEEMSLTADFPYISNKIIRDGQILAFQWLNEWQIFEIKTAKELEPNHFQQITAESLVISELTDEHIEQAEYTDLTAVDALTTALDGTLWSIGDVLTDPVSSADISRGSVWQAVNNIRDNWNVHIIPRYTLDGSGNIGRYLDIKPSEGTFNGVRLSVNKNITDSAVTWDRSNLITAIKGYGATVHEEEGGEETASYPLTFAEAEWEETEDHPAKPLGDEWLIDPDATALYGRNGRPKRGFYQNTSIDDPYILLEKSWESLKNSNTPDLQIEGTVTDLYRLGYADDPLSLHDLVVVEIRPTGFLVEKQVVRLTVDLLNPLNTTPTIGNYIPNIIYINRDTNEAATGNRGGGGGGRGQTNKDEVIDTNIEANKYQIVLEAWNRENKDNQLDSKITITASEIRSEVSKSNSQIYSTISQTATQIRAEVRNTVSGIYSSITQTASQIRAEIVGANSAVYSTIEQTATQIRSEVGTTASNLYTSVITQTSSMIKSEVSSNNSTVYSVIEQTATQIRSEVATTESDLYSSVITQTSSQIRSEVSANNSSVYSAITQNANKISLVVNSDDSINAASIVAGINNQNKESSSYVDISADYINLTGYVTATQLSAVSAEITNLTTGATTASFLKATRMSAGSMSLGGANITTFTLKYKDHSGTNQTVTVLQSGTT